MKFLITESKIEKLIIDWLDKNYGNLKASTDSQDILYKNDDGESILYYSKFFNMVTIINPSLIKMLWSIFNLEESSLRPIFIPWFKKHYGISIGDVEYPYNYKTL